MIHKIAVFSLVILAQVIIEIYQPPASSGPILFSLPAGDVFHYISTTGSDSNDGLAKTVGGGHGPWASMNHTLNCGDVVRVNEGGAFDEAKGRQRNVVRAILVESETVGVYVGHEDLHSVRG